MSRATGSTKLFIDEVTIHVRGGNGGDGCMSFRRELYVPKGGPDGGDGGRGGSVFLVAHDGVDTLLDLVGRHHYFAENGRPGSGANRFGRSGEDLVVVVPTGTLVYDIDAGMLLKDLVRSGQRVRVARGGFGGKGNAKFATSTHQAPREFEPGQKGQERHLRLELKLIADVGFVGLPNAGKSTLLSRLTRARPKIADYAFTTKEPQLGIAELPGFRRLVLADLPGLIEGAHEGVGLGDQFLRHIERTRVILHLVDLHPPEGSPTAVEAYRIIRGELSKYSAALAERDEVVVANKLDLGDDGALAEFADAIGKPVLGISGVTGVGLREMIEQLWTIVQAARERERLAAPATLDLSAAPGTQISHHPDAPRHDPGSLDDALDAALSMDNDDRSRRDPRRGA